MASRGPWFLGVLVLVCCAVCIPAARAGGAVPPGFFGVVPQGSLAQRDYDRMRDVVHTVRLPVFWFQVEPSRGEYRFAELDDAITRAAANGVRILPFVYGSPAWLSRDQAIPPLSTVSARRAWIAFLRRLVDRYGPRGEVWSGGGPEVPIRRWQIWNEPNFRLFWLPRPSPRGYARLLHISAQAIRAEDHGASIVTAGVAPVEAGMRPWTFLRQMYEVPGVRTDFDFVGLHPYAPYVHWVAEQVQFVRQAMKEAGDQRTPLLLTEIGVASSGRYPNAYDKGRRGQASFLRQAFQMLVSRRHNWRIAGVYWFTWQDGSSADPHCVFCEYGGLFDAAGSPKPAWWAFRRAVAGAGLAAVR